MLSDADALKRLWRESLTDAVSKKIYPDMERLVAAAQGRQDLIDWRAAENEFRLAAEDPNP